MQIASGIHHFDTGPFNWYLLEQHGRLTLVDAGFPGHYCVFRRGLESIGRTLADIEGVVITHAHADHLGFARRLQRERNVPVFVHRADLAAARRPLQLPWWGLLSNAWHPFMATMLSRATWNGVFWAPGVADPKAIEDGDILELPGRPRVVHCPGHTPGQIALHLTAANIVLSSDVLITRHLVTGAQGKPQLASAILNHNAAQAARSLDRLSDLGAVTLLPGHGQPWTGNISDAIAEARASPSLAAKLRGIQSRKRL